LLWPTDRRKKKDPAASETPFTTLRTLERDHISPNPKERKKKKRGRSLLSISAINGNERKSGRSGNRAVCLSIHLGFQPPERKKRRRGGVPLLPIKASKAGPAIVHISFRGQRDEKRDARRKMGRKKGRKGGMVPLLYLHPPRDFSPQKCRALHEREIFWVVQKEGRKGKKKGKNSSL